MLPLSYSYYISNFSVSYLISLNYQYQSTLVFNCLFVFYSYVTDFLWPKLDLIDIIVLSQVNAFLSVFSDLLESFFKRCAGVKVSRFFIFSFKGQRKPPMGFK